MTARRNRREWRPDWSIHPGELIVEWLATERVTQVAAAQRIGMKQSQFNDILSGRRGIGPTVAIRLEAMTGISARLLVRMQADHDLSVALAANKELEDPR